VEFEALQPVFGTPLPPVSANKSLIGHAMGASSALETIFTLRGMEDNLLPPTINYRPDPDMELRLRRRRTAALFQEHVLKNAFGFGGCNACASSRKSARRKARRRKENYESATQPKGCGDRLRLPPPPWATPLPGPGKAPWPAEAGFRRVTRCDVEPRSKVVGEIPDWDPAFLLYRAQGRFPVECRFCLSDHGDLPPGPGARRSGNKCRRPVRAPPA
jgi:hypothetical protein